MLFSMSRAMQIRQCSRKISRYLSLLIFILNFVGCASETKADNFLSRGDEALSSQANERAIGLYTEGIDALLDDDSFLTVLSLETNLATALSSVGQNENAAKHYQKAIAAFATKIEEVEDEETEQFAKEIASSLCASVQT